MQKTKQKSLFEIRVHIGIAEKWKGLGGEADPGERESLQLLERKT